MLVLDRSRIVFVDLEASGLGPDSFPIEVGWAFLDGRSGAMLIRPERDWDQDAWDEIAADLHGITWGALTDGGVAARDAAETLNRLLAPADFELLLLSDAAQQDSAWLDRLFEATPEPRRFVLVEEAGARRRLFQNTGLTDDDWASITQEVADSATAIHRAEFDARALAQCWHVAIDRLDRQN